MDRHTITEDPLELGNIIVPETNGNEDFNSAQNSRKNSLASNESIKNFVSLFMVQKSAIHHEPFAYQQAESSQRIHRQFAAEKMHRFAFPTHQFTHALLGAELPPLQFLQVRGGHQSQNFRDWRVAFPPRLPCSSDSRTRARVRLQGHEQHPSES